MTVERSDFRSIFFSLGVRSAFLRYGLTLLVVAAATLATLYIPVFAEQVAFLLFFFGIIHSSFWLGRNPGILATILSLIAVNALILLPRGIELHNLLILNSCFCLVSAYIIATASSHGRSAEALWQSHQDLNLAQSVGQIGNWRINVQRNELLWSDQTHRIFGIAKGPPMTYQTFLSAVHPDDRAYVDRMWQAAMHGEPYNIEHRLLVAGEVKWVRERAVLEFDQNGNLVGGFGTAQDITEQKRSKLALLESQRRYSGIVESAIDAIITIGADQRIVLFNSAAEKMFGCKADQVIGETLDRFIPERFRSAHEAHIRAFDLHGITSRKQGELKAVTGLRANGEEFPIEASLAQFEIDGKKKFTAILRDVSERVRIEFALTERLRLQDQLVKVASTVPGLIYSFRLRPDGSSCMPYASPFIESILGFGFDQVETDFSPVFARIHPNDIGRIQASIAESARTLQPWRNSFRYQHPAKGEIWIEGHSMPLREEDGGTLWHGYIQDVSARIQAEKELQERIDRYELVLDGAQDAIWDWDIVNKQVHYSSRWKALRGYAENEVGSGEEVWQANIHPDDLSRVLAALQCHFEGNSPVFSQEYRIRCKDGSWKWILDRGIAQKNSDGKVIRMAGSESDITHRKRVETALRERERELRLIMDATPALISYVDTDFRYLRVNATYEKWFEVGAEKIIGQRVPEIIGENAWNMVRPYLEQALAGRQVNFDQQIAYGNHQPRWVQATYIPNRDAGGTITGIVIHVVDIEDRKQAVQQIAQLNKDLLRRVDEMQAIFNTVPIGLSIADGTNGPTIRGNPALERIFGVPAGTDLAQLSQVMPAVCLMQNGRTLTAEELPTQRAIRGEAVSNQIVTLLGQDGLQMTLLSNASPLFDESGQPRGAVGAFLDITPLKQAEESLAKSQLQFRLFVEQAPLSVAMLDLDMNYLVTSRRWLDEFGRGYADLIGRNHYAVNPDLPTEWKKVYQLARIGAYLKNDDDLWIQADGSRHWLCWAAYPWTTPEGRIGGIMISCEDISARRQAEQELRNSEARLALVVDEVKAGYWDWDLISRQLFLSAELKRQIGFDDNESLNQREEWERRLHPDDRAFVLNLIEDYMAWHQPNYEAEFRLLHRDGSYRWIHSRGVLLRDANNQPYRMLGINLDITDYIKQRELNERRDKMEQSFRLNVAVQTAAAIAHELNQPLIAISSYADVALHLLQSEIPNPQKLRQILEKSSAQAQRAGEVIRQLLALLQKGENPGEPLDINTAVHEAIDLANADGLLDDYKIELDLATGLPQVKANALQVQKVLNNLLRNGLESMREQGAKAETLTLTTHRHEADPSMVRVTVRDSGIGVADAASLGKIFQPFYTTKPAGLGMGLAISRSLIAAHGGKMWAEQNAGNGIAIHFTLPFLV
ncbi:PAS domain S-box protein [Methylomonas sp. LL1]|uniref:PAS domain S-box protein n=1 Tax=Methylomonas sp. LL1 TaxID=2785785 RepID=UPI0018C430E9|nr:PAS domain S-box protein [Methylomonas sp. LL1]QPK63601.1 PAS domain S-box protein [Methylomonas sp. LL1]